MLILCKQNVKHVVLLFTITSSFAELQINVKPASHKTDILISYSGVDDKKVTGKEVHIFNITSYNLKRGMRVYMGKAPDDIFLGDPTPYHNLYEKYKWKEVQRRITVKRAEVFEIINQNVSLAVHSVINNSTGRLKKKVTLQETVEHTISSSWLDKGIPHDDIYYNINVTYGKNSFNFKNKWRHNNFHSGTLSFGITDIGYILLNPGQAVNFELTAVKTIVLLKVDYSAELIGSTIANYARLYGKYHFWAPSIASIMSAVKLKNEIITTEFIEIRCYVNPYLKIVDKYTLDPVHIIKPSIPFHIKKAKIK